ncbi:MAG: iron uptake porin, partial [Coleofasciculaceae cyanobacterium]
RSLVERYGCIAGYPDGTYRGNRPTTRFEFAAGLNACLDQIVRLIDTGGEVTREDLERLERLIQEFEAELATLGTRVDSLEGRVAFLEDHQFSTTTKLSGEVIFNLASAFEGDERADRRDDDLDGDTDDIDDEITLSDRVRLNFDTSFFGRDRLRTRLQAANIVRFDRATGTDMARLGFDQNNGNDIEIDDLYYRFPFGDNLRFTIAANSVDFHNIADTKNPYFISSGTGAVTRFFRRNPAVYRNSVEAGAGVNIKLGDALGLDLAYLVGDPENPDEKNGLFDGTYSALAQLNFSPFEALDLGFTYARSYYPGGEANLSGSTGSRLLLDDLGNVDSAGARDPFGGFATSANRFGIQGNFQLAPTISIGGWVGYVDAEAEDGPNEDDDAEIWNWAANVAFTDLGKEGAVLGLMAGMPPKLTDIDGGAEDDDTSYMFEVQYRFPINDNILITPSVYLITDPNHNDGNDDIWVGTLRTTFKF